MDPSLILPLGDLLDPYQLYGVSDLADEIDVIIAVLQWFMLVLFVGWAAFMGYCLVKFRAQEGQTAQYEPIKAKASKYLEVFVAVAEFAVLIILVMPAWGDLKTDFPNEDEAVKYRVVAEQFKWWFHHPGKDGKFGRTSPDAIEPGNEVGVIALSSMFDPENPDDVARDPYGMDDFITLKMILPVSDEWEEKDGKKVRKEEKALLYISSLDVIHSFGVPRLRVKQDAVPGQEIPYWITSRITSAELRERLVRAYEVTETKLNYTGWSLMVMEDKGSLSKGDILSWGNVDERSKRIKELQAEGINEILAAPAEPFEVACSQLCGAQHWSMRGVLDYVSREEYDAWVNENSKGGGQ